MADRDSLVVSGSAMHFRIQRAGLGDFAQSCIGAGARKSNTICRLGDSSCACPVELSAVRHSIAGALAMWFSAHAFFMTLMCATMGSKLQA